MSTPHLPPELLDRIVDLLHDSRTALRSCCLASKSWVPRTRSYLFADVKLDSEERLESWKAMFPDPSTSPAHHTKTLFFNSFESITVADWIKGFSHVVHFRGLCQTRITTLVPFHGFSPVIKSLILYFAILPSSQLFDFILSFPLLEDLTMVNCYDAPIDTRNGSDGLSTVIRPSSTPVFTGHLCISDNGGMKSIAHQLLSLVDSIHFRELVFDWHKEKDILSTIGLVGECSHTLESLSITCAFSVDSMPAPVDLSRATRLKDVTFTVNDISQTVTWITTGLRTIPLEHRDLRRISICGPYHSINFRRTAGIGQSIGEAIPEMIRQQWSELDSLLVQFWESHSIRPRVAWGSSAWNRQDQMDVIEYLLPEAARREIVDLVG